LYRIHNSVYYRMDHRISATDLVRRLGDVLARVRYLNDSFIIERNGDPIARLVPIPGASPATVREAFTVWGDAGVSEREFADDLERIGQADQPPEDSWDS
jgi:prevent-host-death family protein